MDALREQASAFVSLLAEEEVVMVLELQAGVLSDASGKIKYLPAFDKV